MSQSASKDNTATAGGPRETLALLADGRVHSGQDMAARLAVTRAAVWKHVCQLRQQGLPIAAVAGRGYQLPWPLEMLDETRIRKALPAASCKALAQLDLLWRPGSTSDVLRQQLDSIGARPRVVLAESQSAGRGRRGRAWVSPPGLNAYLSAGLQFDCGAVGLAGLSLALGVMLMRALADVGFTDAGLKWPNDVIAGGGKLAGVLVEIEGEYSGPATVIIGIGLNLRMPDAQRRAAGQPVSDLASLMSDQLPSRNIVLSAIISQVLTGLEQFRQHGFAAFGKDYARHDLLKGKALKILAAQGDWQGQGAGVDSRGALRVQTGTGVTLVDSGEVSVRGA